MRDKKCFSSTNKATAARTKNPKIEDCYENMAWFSGWSMHLYSNMGILSRLQYHFLIRRPPLFTMWVGSQQGKVKYLGWGRGCREGWSPHTSRIRLSCSSAKPIDCAGATTRSPMAWKFLSPFTHLLMGVRQPSSAGPMTTKLAVGTAFIQVGLEFGEH